MFIRAAITAVHGYVPPDVLTNAELARLVDTSDAWYKLDDHPAKPWRDLRAELVAAGSLAEAERLDNPSGGRVVIPFDVLKGAMTVDVRPTRRASPHAVTIRPVWTAIASAEGLGCSFGSHIENLQVFGSGA